MTAPFAKILVVYHKPATSLETEILTPIHVGRALGDFDLPGMITDNTGDNISAKNDIYCELTAIYWAWKNYEGLGSPEYIGLMHYRRHLIFDINHSYKEDIRGVVPYDYLDEHYLRQTCLNDGDISTIIDGFDIVTGKKWDVRLGGHKNIYEQYAYSSDLNIADYDMAMRVLAEYAPEYISFAEAYNSSPLGNFTNIAIMKKDIFSEYCSWLFSILFEVESRITITPRVLGHISERLFGIFLLKKETEGKKICELQRTFIDRRSIRQKIIRQLKDFVIKNFRQIHYCHPPRPAGLLTLC